ncbi:metallophosphoesterase [Allocoleopsis sp.]|uniref:metallophosphoesterase n=1 Tax=Allocoleopsis sp. TaxID=3088169 RepID=UPI002FCFC802
MEIRKKNQRKLLTFATTLALALVTGKAALAGNGTPINPHSDNVLTVAVFGDSPYGTSPTDTSQTQALPAFINSINADPKVDLVLHVGDIHSGKQYCTEAYDRTVYSLWTGFKNPLIYTPGDNEWTDCHKVGEGGGAYNKTTQQIDYVRDAQGNLVDYAGGDPIANLELIRSIFFANPGYSLGGRKQQVQSQAKYFDPAYPTDAKFVENTIWMQSKVLFVTINLPGGSNNDTDVWYGAPSPSEAQSKETSERTGADLRWLDAAFQTAAAYQAEAIVIVTQADMWDSEKGAAHQAKYEPLVQSIASHTKAFGKPVLMFNGDSHTYRSDNPLSPTASCTLEGSASCTSVASIHPGYDVSNFHRVVVHGSTFPLEWLKLTIDPKANYTASPNAFDPFTWERIQP